MGLAQLSRFNECLRRLLAIGCVALVFALGVFAASPVLHDQLHRDAVPPADDGCAVVLFASGVSVPLAMVEVSPEPMEWCGQEFVGSDELLLDSPRYRLLPGRGPPVG